MIDLRRSAAMALLLAVPLLAATGCSKALNKAAGPDVASAGAADGASSPAAGEKDQATGPVLSPDKFPVLKAGLWKTTRTSEGRTVTDQHCQSGKPMKPLTMGKACSNVSAHRTLFGGFVMDASCAMSGMSMKLHMKARGDWNSHYSLDTSSEMKMQGQPDQIHSEHIEGAWAGACPAGMAPVEQ